MKAFLLGITLFFAFSAYASGDTCVAVLVTKLEYRTTINYRVFCSDPRDDFETTENGRWSLIPLHFDGQGVAKAKLLKGMTSRGYEEVATIQAPKMENGYRLFEPYVVFEQQPSGASFCTAIRDRGEKTGPRGDVIRFDAVLNCTGPKQNDIVYSSVTPTEIDQELTKNGFHKLFDSNARPYLWKAGGISVFSNR